MPLSQVTHISRYCTSRNPLFSSVPCYWNRLLGSGSEFTLKRGFIALINFSLLKEEECWYSEIPCCFRNSLANASFTSLSTTLSLFLSHFPLPVSVFISYKNNMLLTLDILCIHVQIVLLNHTFDIGTAGTLRDMEGFGIFLCPLSPGRRGFRKGSATAARGSKCGYASGWKSCEGLWHVHHHSTSLKLPNSNRNF